MAIPCPESEKKPVSPTPPTPRESHLSRWRSPLISLGLGAPLSPADGFEGTALEAVTS